MAFEIRVPRLGWSMEQGTFLGWLKKDGDRVNAGDVLYELEGEKATQEIEATDAGILRIPTESPTAGTVVPVGSLLGFLVKAGESTPAFTRVPVGAAEAPTKDRFFAAPPSVRRLARQTGVDLSTVSPMDPSGRISHEDVRRAAESRRRTGAAPPVETTMRTNRAVATPRARRAANELGVDWRGLEGSGRNGRIRERDVRSATGLELGGGSVPITTFRRTIADRMLASRQNTAPVTLTTRADATQLVQLRKRYLEGPDRAGAPSYTDVFIKVVAEILSRHPILSARWEGDRLVLPNLDSVGIGVAVDTPDGLIVPVVRDVPRLSLEEISAKTLELIARARTRRLAAADMQGGAITITNLGAFGVDAFTPIINLPEAAILGLGAIRREAVVNERDQIVVRDVITLSLTFDHRIVDGAPAARFLQDVVMGVEDVAEPGKRRE